MCISPDCSCGKRASTRIAGGEATSLLEFPWMLGLLRGSGLLPGHTFCGATLVATGWAVTAAHCVSDSAGGISVVAGEHDQDTSSIFAETNLTKIVSVAKVG